MGCCSEGKQSMRLGHSIESHDEGSHITASWVKVLMEVHAVSTSDTGSM